MFRMFWVSPDGNCAYVYWGFFTSISKSVRRAIWFTWFSEPNECIQHLAVPGGHPSNYGAGATLLNFSARAQTVERTPYSVYIPSDIDPTSMTYVQRCLVESVSDGCALCHLIMLLSLNNLDKFWIWIWLWSHSQITLIFITCCRFMRVCRFCYKLSLKQCPSCQSD